MNSRFGTLVVTACAAVLAASCGAGVPPPKAPTEPPPAGASLWREPSDIATRDLFNGPWGAESAPDPHATYTLVERKHSGVNLGMTVVDDRGREWSVKQPFPGNLDSEAPVEVTLSRILSGIGYHQPPVFYLPAFKLKDDFGTRVETGGRFRLKLENLDETTSWRWDENPFVGTRPYEGLIVMLMMFNSTDLKASNNSLYEYRGDNRVEQWYVVRDIGSAFGDTNDISPRKNHIDSFERAPFIVGAANGHLQFAYDSWYKNLVLDRIKPEDARWAADLLGRLSDKQWNDAFRAGGFEPDRAQRFIAKLKQKIGEARSAGMTAGGGN